MDNFIKKWKSDKKYQAKIKLILYGIFIVLVALYASTLNTNMSKEDKKENLIRYYIFIIIKRIQDIEILVDIILLLIQTIKYINTTEIKQEIIKL